MPSDRRQFSLERIITTREASAQTNAYFASRIAPIDLSPVLSSFAYIAGPASHELRHSAIPFCDVLLSPNPRRLRQVRPSLGRGQEPVEGDFARNHKITARKLTRSPRPADSSARSELRSVAAAIIFQFYIIYIHAGLRQHSNTYQCRCSLTLSLAR